MVFWWASEVPFEFRRCRLDAVDGVCKVFTIRSWEVMRVQGWGEVTSEQFDEPAVLFFLICVT